MSYEINALVKAINEGNGFNWMCRGNGYDITKEEYRTLIRGLLYAMESAETEVHDDVLDEFLDNIPEDWMEQPDDAMKWHVGDRVRVRSDLKLGERLRSPVNGFGWVFVMDEYAGKEATITDMDNTTYILDVDNGTYFYPPMFLEDIEE